MALMGVRPSPADLASVRENPGALRDIVEQYLDDPRFGENIRDMHAEQLHLRWDVNDHIPPEGPLAEFSTTELIRATDETPLKLIEWVVTSGRPYSEIVTSDMVFANKYTAIAYGLPFDPGGPEWQESYWPDGRPAGGILVDNGYWIRFPSSSANYQRSRGAEAAKLVCDNLAERPLKFDVFEPSDPSGVSQDPTCLACHSALDPMSSTFWGARLSLSPTEVREAFGDGCQGETAYACYPLQMWYPEEQWDAEFGAEFGLAQPAWYGTPVSDLGELGQVIAEDPRFATCTARRFWSWFTESPLEDVPFEIWGPLSERFVDSGLSGRELALEVVLHPDFDPVLTVRPEQYARFVEDLTGYVWTGTPDSPGCGGTFLGCVGEVDLARNDVWGNHTLMGGADGYYALDANVDPSPARFLAQSWLAEEAAFSVVRHDLAAEAGERRLLLGADPWDTTEAAVHAQLVYLHERILAEREPDVQRTQELFQQALDRHGGEVAPAWALVITALLLDSVVY
jgi:hypothetical protein